MKKMFMYFLMAIMLITLSGCADKEYTVTYEVVNGESVESEIVVEGDLVTEPDEQVLEGHSFNAWYTDSELTTLFDFETVITNDITLYSEMLINQYQFNFNLNSDSIIESTVLVRDYGTIIEEIDDPIKEGYTFDGWYTDETYTTPYNFNNPLIGDINVYAGYTGITYDVLFVLNLGPSTIPSVTVEHRYNETIDEPLDPYRDGYLFTGWYSDFTTINLYTFGNIIEADISLYAGWELDPAWVPRDVYKIALITDSGSIDDASYNQAAWEGIVTYAEEHNINYKYYRPLEVSDDAYLDAISIAVESGAEVIVLPGWLFESACYFAQQLYPDVQFIIVDGAPHNPQWTEWETTDNTLSILFNEHEAGFLAGYAAVVDGYTNLGFAGGMAVPQVVKYGVGYIAGAYYASKELGIEITFSDDRYIYFGDFGPSDTYKQIAITWYQSGTEIIFSVAGGAGYSVMSAAADEGGMVIGVDIDQSNNSSVILTSAMKNMTGVVYSMLGEYYDGTIINGQSRAFGINEDGLMLPMETSRFNTFNQAAYDDIYELISNGTVNVPYDYETLVAFFATHSIGAMDYPTEATINGTN